MIGLATGSLVAAIWQGMLLAVAVGLGLRCLPKTPAAVRFAIWFGVFAVVTAMPAIVLMGHASGGSDAAGHRAWLMLDPRWSLAIAAIWGIASLVRAGTLVAAGFRVRSLWKRARPVEGSANSVETQGSRRVQLCVSDEVDRPTVIGFFAPKILVPSWLLEKLTAAELEQIVLHEAGHLGRADDWLNLLQKIALVVFPLNPSLAWVERRLCFERELACDERVLRTTGAPKAYAACLASLAEHRLGRSGISLALGALGRESELGRRVGRILRRGETMRPMQAKLVLGCAMVALLTAGAGLERCPQVVGFARQGTGDREQRAAVETSDGYGYRGVVFRPDARVVANLRQKTNSAHETLLTDHMKTARTAAERGAGMEHTPEPRRNSGEYGVRAVSVNAVVGPAEASKSEFAPRESQISTERVSTARTSAGSVQPQEPPVVQWLVVTSWQSGDGMHMVLTTSRSSSANGSSMQEFQVPGGRGSDDQVYPYAAVPVRDGWLVFQL